MYILIYLNCNPIPAKPFLNLWLLTVSWWSRYLIATRMVWDIGKMARNWDLNSGLRCLSKTTDLGFGIWQTKHFGWVAFLRQFSQKIWPQFVKPYLKVSCLISFFMHRLHCTQEMSICGVLSAIFLNLHRSYPEIKWYSNHILISKVPTYFKSFSLEDF